MDLFDTMCIYIYSHIHTIYLLFQNIVNYLSQIRHVLTHTVLTHTDRDDVDMYIYMYILLYIYIYYLNIMT